jgi:hypothetical protein
MSDATLKQAGKVLALIARSGRSSDWVQNHLIGSGTLSDLLDVDDLVGMDRHARRRFLGLSALNPPLLEEIGTVTVPATIEPFVVRNKFVLNTEEGAQVKIVFLERNFQKWFGGKIEEPVIEATLCYAKLRRPSLIRPVFKELGDKAETTFTQIYALMERQANGEEGVLFVNGRMNIFCVVNGLAVIVYWHGGGWYVTVRPVDNSFGWSYSDQVFFRNS